MSAAGPSQGANCCGLRSALPDRCASKSAATHARRRALRAWALPCSHGRLPAGRRVAPRVANDGGHTRVRRRRCRAARATAGDAAPSHVRQPAGARGRRVRRVPGASVRWPRVHPRCHRPRRRRGAVGGAFVPLGCRMARVQSRGRRSQGQARSYRRSYLRASVARALRRRRYRNERQDVVHALDSAMPRGLRPEERSPRHARQRAGRRARCVGAHDARRSGGPRDPRPAARRRRRSRRDGSLVARPGAGARQRRRVRRRAVHESHARSSRLSRDDGGVRGSQGAASSPGLRSRLV